MLNFFAKWFGAGALFAAGIVSAFALTSLQRDITATGIDQPTLVDFLGNVVTKVNAVDASVDSNVTLATELRTDHATNIAVIADNKTLVNDIRTYLTGDRLWSGNPGLAIDTNFDVQTANAAVVSIDGVLYSVAAATLDTGTSATFASAKWGCLLVSANTSGALVGTWDTNSSAGYDDEASAIAACITGLPASQAPVGYVTVLAAGSTWLAGTDALEGGTGGTPATTTNYYDLADPLATVSAAVSTSPAATITASAPTAVSDTDDLTLSRP